MKITRVGRCWVVIALVVALILVSVRLLDSSFRLYSYQLLDPQTIVVEGGGAKGALVHVTDVEEGASSVTVSVNVFTFAPGPGTMEGYRLGAVVYLSAPLGDRSVIDGSTGQPVQQTGCAIRRTPSSGPLAGLGSDENRRRRQRAVRASSGPDVVRRRPQ